MSSALDTASLIMIPSGYEDGTLGSLKPTDETGDFTFTRGSNISATRVNADGNIEKGYENLLLQSNTFSDDDWTWYSTSVTGGQTDRDGGSDAYLIIRSSGGGLISRQLISLSGVYTFSIYVKINASNGIGLSFAGTSEIAHFNISDENQTAAGAVIGLISATQEYVGNNFYRLSITGNTTAPNVRLYLSNAAGTLIDSGGGSHIIQDAMLNQGMVAYPYVETTTAPIAGGILEDMPRLDYSNGSCPSLLLEPSRINSITSSEYFQSGWSNLGSRVSFEHNTADTLSPEGKYNATKLIKNSSGNPTLRANATTPGNAYVFTCWAKAGTSNILELDISDATATGFTLTNKWQRFEVKTTSSANNFVDISLRTSANVGDYIYVWGAQVEEGSFKTSYIPTYGVSQTRLGEVINSNISSLGVADEFTLFIDTNGALVSGTSLNAMDDLRWYTQSTNYYRFYKSSDALFISYNIQVNDRTKIALKITETECKTFVDGVLDSAISLATPFASFNSLIRNTENKLKDNLNQLLVFPTALSDDECIELTTI